MDPGSSARKLGQDVRGRNEKQTARDCVILSRDGVITKCSYDVVTSITEDSTGEVSLEGRCNDCVIGLGRGLLSVPVEAVCGRDIGGVGMLVGCDRTLGLGTPSKTAGEKDSSPVPTRLFAKQRLQLGPSA